MQSGNFNDCIDIILGGKASAHCVLTTSERPVDRNSAFNIVRYSIEDVFDTSATG
jgi:hypothetical protein